MKNLILKTLITLFAATCSSVAYAQTNLKSGYIITLQNDTIHGTINYRMEKKNERRCKFRRDGERKFTSYSPEEINAYRADNDEFYYVAKTVDINGKPVRKFVGYLVKGGMNLYHYLKNGKIYYLLEGENGEMAQIIDASVANNIKNVPQATVRQNMAGVTRVFTPHPQELNKFKTSSFNSRDLSDIVIDYNKTYCRDLGDCIQYSGNNSTEPSVKVNFLVGAGLIHNSSSVTDVRERLKTEGKTISPSIHIGANFDLPRFSKYLFAQAKLQLSYVNYSFPVLGYFSGKDEDTSIKSTQFDLMVGIGCRLLNPTTHKYVPFVHAGLGINAWLTKKMDKDIVPLPDYDRFTFNTSTLCDELQDGAAYVGAGIFLPLGKHKMEVAFDYHQLSIHRLFFKSKLLSLTASFVF